MWNFQIESLFRKPAFVYSVDVVVDIVQKPQDKSIEELIKQRTKQNALDNLKKAKASHEEKRLYNKNFISDLIKEREYTVNELVEITALSHSQVSRIVALLQDEKKATYTIKKINRSFTRFWKAIK